MTGVIIKPILVLLNMYLKDAMLSADIIQLLKILQNVPDNTAFKQVILPEVKSVVKQLQVYACEQENAVEV